MMTRFDSAKARYEALGVSVEAALNTLAETPLSVHIWQGDDVAGFDSREALSGGIQTTGNYPGRATTPEQLMQDFDKALSLMPGSLKLNLHASYAIPQGEEPTPRNRLTPEDFAPWISYAKERGLGLDFNPTFFSHPMVKEGMTLSSPDPEVRQYWIEHGICCLRIAETFARECGQPCLINFWMPDGFKDYPGDRLGPRKRMQESLDAIFAAGYDKELVIPTLESKVFGIGLEACTVGSSEFCLGYALSRGLTPLMDAGHYHPTEAVEDKISSLLLYADKVALHVTRPMRWDSDHVVSFDDQTRSLMTEAVRGGISRVLIATDYFDASINRIAAWVNGVRNTRKALLYALLQPPVLKELQDQGDFTSLAVLQEEQKLLPLGDIWEEFLRREQIVSDYLPEVKTYEREVLLKR